MLTEICQYLHNWFNRKPDGSDYPKYKGEFTITNGVIDCDGLTDGQYFRILGSLLNDGVHKYGTDTSGEQPKLYETLSDETFTGEVWSMGIPPIVVDLAKDIKDWQTQFGAIDSPSMSPYNSESFAGYTYNKSGGGTSDGTTAAGTWQGAFAKRLSPWRKI